MEYIRCGKIYLNLCKMGGFLFRKNKPTNCRYYHSDKVFGFKRKSPSVYKVPDEVLERQCKNCNFYRLVTACREHGHKHADINPVALTREISVSPELDLNRYSLKENDKVKFSGILNIPIKDEGTVAEAVQFLHQVYSKHIALEFTHLENEEEIDWFSYRTEEIVPEIIDNSTKLRVVLELLHSQNVDHFLANKFASVKRYGGEGAESMMTFFGEFFQLAAKHDLDQLVIAMPHRGRLNLLTGLLNFSPVNIFAKLKGKSNFPSKYQVTGDVLSHFIASTDLHIDNKTVHVSMLYNPSHLEAVNPVSMGKTRAKQLESKDGDYGDKRWSDKILNLQVHGDAAIAGQGVNQECLILSGAPHFEIGGTIHLVVNNQLGFTTPADRGRSSRYCTDLAKLIAAPVIHVNGDFPEMVLKATRLAFEYQRQFRKSVFVDINCYRKWGHNELDDPTFTNPALYRIIRSRGTTVPDLYANKLIEEGILSEAEKETIVSDHTKWLNQHLKAVDDYRPEDVFFKRQWEGFGQAEANVTTWDTGIHLDLLTFVGSKSVTYPHDFNIHPQLLKTHVKNRLSRVAEGVGIDWSTAETLAMGSLLHEGYNVRISGQDVGRGTFSHRHVMLVDQETNRIYIPLNNLHEKQAFLEIANSILSEEAVLGFEFGMSVESPKNLIIWEAQFGDFFNGAQIILDTFVSSSEAKWLWTSGLVILLPHGYDGAGPEHSSSRIERFLQMTDSKEDAVDGDNVNMEVCHPSTPAQYFHLLRRQMVRNFRKPLVIIAPKTLLRLSTATSNFSEMAPQTTFMPVIGDDFYDPIRIETVLLTAGKHYYNLKEKRETLGLKNVAIVRLESYCPFPTLQLQQQVSKYSIAKRFLWCQEEPQNMGAWSFVKPRFENLVGRKIQYCGRPTLAAPAVGISDLHEQQAADIITKPFTLVTEGGIS